MRLCTRCDTERPLTAFSWKNKSAGLLAYECKPCHRIIRKRYYEVNRKSEMSRINARKQELKRWLLELKSTMKCSKCPESHPATLQFHHRRQLEKEIEVSDSCHRGSGRERILREIKKCIILCANCHAKEHFETKTGPWKKGGYKSNAPVAKRQRQRI